MVKHKDFIFIHFPKTAGKSILSYFDECLQQDPNYIYGKLDHLGYWWLTPEEQKRNIFGFIREPLSWYRSFYYFFRNKEMINFAGSDFGSEAKKAFTGTIDLSDKKVVREDFNRCMFVLINTDQKIPLLINNEVEHRVTGLDYYSNLFLSLFTHNYEVPKKLTIYRYENLDKEMNLIQARFNLPIKKLGFEHKYNKDRLSIEDLFSKEIITLLDSKLKEGYYGCVNY